MSDYFTAWLARRKRNHAALVQLAWHVITLDPSIEIYINNSGDHIDSMKFIKDETINSIGFHEVPYRWSGCGYGEHTKSHYGHEGSLEMPFTAKDVLTTMRPITSILRTHNEPFKSKEHYLKWCSYLVPFKPGES